MPISFEKPIYLLLCLLVPFVWMMMNRSPAWESSRNRKLVLGATRSLLVILLALTLSEPQVVTHSDRVNLFFCKDVSESVGRDTKQTSEAVLEKIASGMNKEDLAGLIMFGKHPSLEIPLTSGFRLQSLRSDINRNYTNIKEALQFAIGKFPQKGNHRIVLFSDGNENLESAVEMAYLAASLGIEIYPVPLATWFGKNEVYVQALETPPVVSLDTPFEIKIIIGSSEAKEGELILFRNDRLMINETITLQPGKNVFTFADAITDSGLYLYKAVGNFSEDVFFSKQRGAFIYPGNTKIKNIICHRRSYQFSSVPEDASSTGLEPYP